MRQRSQRQSVGRHASSIPMGKCPAAARVGDLTAALQRLADRQLATSTLQRTKALATARPMPVLQGDFTLTPPAPPAPHIQISDTRAGRGELWRRSNAAGGPYTVHELPQALLSANNWKALVTEDELNSFFTTGTLTGEIADDVARRAYLHPDALAVRPLDVSVHERMSEEHLAASNSEADKESRRRFLADPNQATIGHKRTFSWVIGARPTGLRSRAEVAATSGAVRSNIYQGREQLNVRMPISNRRTEVERREFSSRGAARAEGATDIIDFAGSNRCSGVLTERTGGTGSTTLTGGWDTRTNAFQLYHFEARGLPAADFLTLISKRLFFRSAGPGQRAVPDPINMRLPVPGLLAVI